MGRIVNGIIRVLVVLFGGLRWTPPVWLRWIFNITLAPIGRGLSHFYRPARRVRNTVISILLLLIAASGVYLYQYEPEKVFEVPPLEVKATLVPPGLKIIGADNPPRPLIIKFDGSAALIEQMNKVVEDASLLDLSPEIEGTWKWQGDKELHFQPNKDWPVSTEFELEIDEGFLRDDILIEEIEFEFTTQPFTAKLANAQFFQDEAAADIKKVAATINFSHPVDRKSFEQRVKFALIKKKDKQETFSFEVEYNEFDTKAFIRSANIPIPMKDTSMKIEIGTGVSCTAGGKGTPEKLEKSVAVPGMYTYFRVNSSELGFARNDKDEQQQVLVLVTKVQMHEKEMAKNFEAWLLPKFNNDKDGDGKEDEYDPGKAEDKRPYGWSTTQVDKKVLARGERIKLEQIPTEREYSKLHSFKLRAPVGRYVYIKLKKRTKAWGGYVLADTWDRVHRVPVYPKELSIMYDGSILTTGGNKKLSLSARGINGVKLELWRILPSELNHFISQTEGRFSKPHFNGYSFDEENIAEVFIEKKKLDGTDPSKTQYTSVDFSKHLYSPTTGVAHGLFLLHAKSWDPKRNTTTGRSDKRMVLVTDMGILEKRDAAGKMHVFVQSIKSGGPKAGVKVEILAKNGLPLLTKRTDNQGYASFPRLSSFSKDKEPIAIVARFGDDFSFLPLDRSDRNLNFSRFDVGGVFTDGSPDKLRAYLFSERGIYRPGDQIHIGLIAKASDWNISIKDIPIEVTITDPRGVEVYKERHALPQQGFLELAHTTQQSSPTGTYSVTAHLIKDDDAYRSIGSTSVRVEEFLPDKMKIKSELLPDSGNGWLPPKDIRAKVTLQNLYGTPATDRTVEGRIVLSSRYPSFKGYGDYRFYDAARAKGNYTKELSSLITDENGEVLFDIDLSSYENATYTLSFFAEGFEAGGGRSVSSKASMMISPLDYLVGYKAEGGSLYGVSNNSKRKLNFIAINSKLKKRKAGGLTAILHEKRYVSTLVRLSSGTYKYQSVEKKVEISRSKLSIGKDGYDYTLPTGNPGEFVFTIMDKKQGELAIVPFSVAGAANTAGNLEARAKLDISLDKKDYDRGDTISIDVKAPYTGAGLITIERDKVLAHKWFKASTKRSVQTIQVPAGVDVNAYVNVAYVRDGDSDEIFLDPLCHAAVPFFITRDARTHQISLDVQDEVKPGEVLKIGYSTTAPSKIAVFAVDEGILQVAAYRTPDPLKYFLAKRALEVTTSQIMDMILPEHNTFSNPSTTGAGDEDDEASGHNLNPFKRKREKPVVFWSGILDGDQEEKVLKYTVPDYFNGSLRLMAVAVSTNKLGATSDKVTVKGPFVVQPSTPLFAVPGDEFKVSTTVANNVEGSGKNANIKVSLEVSKHLQVKSEKSISIIIPEGREKTVEFDVKALSKLGSADLKFTAKHKKKSISFNTSLSVRPGSPHTTTLAAGVLDKGKTSIPISRSLYNEYRKLNISVSPLPLALADGLVAYLEKFPHGCTEQIVSQTVPALVLSGHPEFGFDKAASNKAITRTIRMLRSRQNDEGAFGFWAANSHVSNFQVIWATLFLTEAKERGASVPGDILDKALSYLSMVIKDDLDSLDDARIRAFAIYVRARNGELSTDSLAGLREFLAEDENKGWKKDAIAGYLAATYQLIQDRTEAKKLAKAIELNPRESHNYDNFYDSQMYRGTMLYLLSKHFPAKASMVPNSVIADMAKGIAKGQYNTISSASLIYGLEAYASHMTNAGTTGGPIDIKVLEVISDKERHLKKLKGNLISRGSFSSKARSIEISTKASSGAFFQVTIAGFDRDDGSNVEIKKGVEILREFQTTDGKPIENVELGEEIEVVIKLRSINDTRHSNLAVVDLLPAGFEVILPRGQGGSNWGRLRASGSTWSPEYADAREDRVVLYGTVGSDIKIFVYRIKAVAKGTFVVPPAFVKSMYDPAVSARTKSSVMTVVGH